MQLHRSNYIDRRMLQRFYLPVRVLKGSDVITICESNLLHRTDPVAVCVATAIRLIVDSACATVRWPQQSKDRNIY